MKKKTSSSISLRTWIRNTHWKRHLRDGAKTIVQSPVNFLVFFLALNVVVWGAFLVLLLSKAVQLKGGSEQQGLWIEICGQTINGIFTIAAVPVHPKRFMGLVRALAIWRREKGIRTQFLSLFLEQHHQARLGQEEHEGVATTTCRRTLKESEEELLEMIDYFNAFPEYGHDRATAAAAAAHDTPTRMDEATTIKVSPQGHDGEPTLAPSYTNTNTSTSTPYYSTSPNQEPNEDDSLRQQPSPQQQQQQPQATAAAPPSLSRQPTTTTLQIDIPEQELDNLLAHETQRVVRSCVLSYLPLTPTINPDQGPTLGAFADDGNATTTTSSTTTTPTTEPSTPLSLSTSIRTQSNVGRRSTRTRARTRTMTMKDGHVDNTIIDTTSAGAAGATGATTTTAAAVGTSPGGRHSGSGDRPARGSFQRRPTYVVRETSEALLSHKDRPLNGGGALQEKEKEKRETLEISATTTLVEEEGHDRYNNDNDTSSSSSGGGGSGQETTEPIVCLEPLPLTPEQVAWLDERQRGLVERKARLQQSWPWYTYKMPVGVEPVDFMAACQSFLSSSSSSSSSSSTKRDEKGRAAPLSSLSSSSSTSPNRMKLIQSPTKQLQMRASKACLILLSFNLNSMIQEVLCGFMWGWHYSTRPVAVVGAGVASGCLTALIPTIVIFLHERRLSKVRVVASTEEAIQEVIDAHPQK